MKDKITKQAVESLNPGTKDRFLWDTELPMFGCKNNSQGQTGLPLAVPHQGTFESLDHWYSWGIDRQGGPKNR